VEFTHADVVEKFGKEGCPWSAGAEPGKTS
jgi:hypothetical protein